MNKQKQFMITILMLLFSLSMFAQDKLAYIAPNDVKMKAIDTLILRKIKHHEEYLPASELYSDWNNTYAHKYYDDVPEIFSIDLRGFEMPTTNKIITSSFGKRHGRMHNGIDIKVTNKDTIYAAFDGKVRISSYERHGYGNYVVIRHYNGLETIYGHMSKKLVKENQYVKAGTPIGIGGNTGRSTGSHLHFETRFIGIAINPALIFDFVYQDIVDDFYVFKYSKHKNTQISRRTKK